MFVQVTMVPDCVVCHFNVNHVPPNKFYFDAFFTTAAVSAAAVSTATVFQHATTQP